MTAWVEAALGLGGNVGDVSASFAQALASLAQTQDFRLLRTSSVYRTRPWGKVDQPDFLNMAAMFSTRLNARQLLEKCLLAERQAGRVRAEKWGPRTLDIDILTFGNEMIDEPGLIIPHPRIAERAFVLVPLAEIAGDLEINGVSVSSIAAKLDCRDVTLDPVATGRLREDLKRIMGIV